MDQAPPKRLGSIQDATVAAHCMGDTIKTFTWSLPPRISLANHERNHQSISLEQLFIGSREPLFRAASTSAGRRSEENIAIIRSALLNAVPVLRVIKDGLDSLCQYASYRAFKKNELAVEMGKPVNALYLIIRGIAARQKRRHVPPGSFVPFFSNLETLRAGDSFGGFRLMREADTCLHDTDVRAMLPFHVLRFDDADLEELFKNCSFLIPLGVRIDYLARHSIAKLQTWEQVLLLCDALQLERYKSGETITEQGSRATDFFFVVSGNVNLRRELPVRHEGGHVETSALDVVELSWGETFGRETLLFGDGESHHLISNTAVARSECRVLRITRTKLLPSLQAPGSDGALLSESALAKLRSDGELPGDEEMIRAHRALVDWNVSRKKYCKSVLDEARALKESRRRRFLSGT